MTQAEYKDYQGRVAAFIAVERIDFLSTGTKDLLSEDSDTEDTGEPWFSWSACDCCGATAGHREYLYARDTDNEIAQYAICELCVYYVNYARIEQSEN